MDICLSLEPVQGQDWLWLGEVFLRLLLAVILGGMVGYEREHANRPAGFRTHILVSLGAALVMVLAEFLTRQYAPALVVDPTRLGAQVVSGIGFLGAGTIIRNGSSVRGLTTAASVWAVSCIGLACGGGFYLGAVIATAFMVITLITLKRLEKYMARRHGDVSLVVHLSQYGEDVSHIMQIISDMQASIRRVQIQPVDPDDELATGIRLRLGLSKISEQSKAQLIMQMKAMQSVLTVTIE